MKNTIIKLKFLFTLSIIFLFVLGCNRENDDQEMLPLTQERTFISAKNLSLDINFLNIANEMQSYSQFLEEKIDNHNIPSKELKVKLEAILYGDLSSEEQIMKLNLLFDTNFGERILENAKIVNSNFRIINDKYNNINEGMLTSAFNYSFKVNQNDGCSWRYYACLSAAYAGAVLCHAGCDTTALATTAGLGIPACIALCGTLQVYASVQCLDTYCK